MRSAARLDGCVSTTARARAGRTGGRRQDDAKQTGANGGAPRAGRTAVLAELHAQEAHEAGRAREQERDVRVRAVGSRHVRALVRRCEGRASERKVINIPTRARREPQNEKQADAPDQSRSASLSSVAAGKLTAMTIEKSRKYAGSVASSSSTACDAPEKGKAHNQRPACRRASDMGATRVAEARTATLAEPLTLGLSSLRKRAASSASGLPSESSIRKKFWPTSSAVTGAGERISKLPMPVRGAAGRGHGQRGWLGRRVRCDDGRAGTRAARGGRGAGAPGRTRFLSVCVPVAMGLMRSTLAFSSPPWPDAPHSLSGEGRTEGGGRCSGHHQSSLVALERTPERP